jgi:hypothetical protein
MRLAFRGIPPASEELRCDLRSLLTIPHPRQSVLLFLQSGQGSSPPCPAYPRYQRVFALASISPFCVETYLMRYASPCRFFEARLYFTSHFEYCFRSPSPLHIGDLLSNKFVQIVQTVSPSLMSRTGARHFLHSKYCCYFCSLYSHPMLISSPQM